MLDSREKLSNEIDRVPTLLEFALYLEWRVKLGARLRINKNK